MKNTFRIIVISDTHKNISNAIDIITAEKPDYVLHLGDLEDDADQLRYIFDRTEIINVCGNCDWGGFSNAPTERMLDIGGVKILMCHGHTYSVKNDVERYRLSAKEKGAHIALFGHTHIPLYEHNGDVALMNPGTVSTYGWIKIADGGFKAGINAFGELK